MSCTVPDDSEHEVSHVRLPHAGVQQRQRENGAAIHRHANEDDAARAKAIDPPAQQRGAQTQRDRSDCEAAGDGFTTPAEFGSQRLNKDREGCRQTATRIQPSRRGTPLTLHANRSSRDRIHSGRAVFRRPALWLCQLRYFREWTPRSFARARFPNASQLPLS
jgi:hypothetical protein